MISCSYSNKPFFYNKEENVSSSPPPPPFFFGDLREEIEFEMKRKKRHQEGANFAGEP